MSPCLTQEPKVMEHQNWYASFLKFFRTSFNLMTSQVVQIVYISLFFILNYKMPKSSCLRHKDVL